MTPAPFFYRETSNIRVTVRPRYQASQSRPARGHFVFSYAIRIENVGPATVQLKSRHWFIHDSIGEDTEVEGEGVVGEQPVLPPGGVYEYQSFCVLRSPSGHMEGRYYFSDEGDNTFDVVIPRFTLQVRSDTLSS